MSAIRLPLLWAFAGGCLTNAALFGLWRATEPVAPPVRSARASHRVVEEAVPAPTLARPAALVAVSSAEPRTDAPAEPAGSSVSDVLARLESEYRDQVAARAPAPSKELALAEPPAPPAPEPVVVAAPVAVPPLAPAAVVATVAVATPSPPVPAPPTVAEPASIARNEPAPSRVQYGDVNQNTYITNVRQGDVYLIQMQQLAMLQYMQLMGMSSGAAVPPRAFAAGGGGHQRFPSGITNPDNPWGFHFSPPNLVR